MNEQTPKKVLPYEPPPDKPRRAFGSVGGNMAVGLAGIVASVVISVAIVYNSRGSTLWSVAWTPVGVALLIGGVAACFPRYRGVLAGMLSFLLVAALCIVGLALLAIGLCFGGGNGSQWMMGALFIGGLAIAALVVVVIRWSQRLDR